ncbi:MAG: cation diffusion facilitator family transporter [Acidobacteria bacterium]|nr:cation diffusion facilitator family transporter [Acidobacteriota bacterium]MCL5288612.1 cation diffusion facilitator family transporter [Acidobacteriota bacterium]
MPGEHHEHHAHDHAQGMKGTLGWSLAATVALVAAEFAGGYVGRSIALTSDAVHNLTDLPPMILSLLALRWAELPPTSEKTYGFRRAGILVAFVNALLLALAALFILYESWQRLWQPVEVRAGWMIGVATFALVINGGITLALVRGRRDLNLRSILIHNFGDALSNVAILAGALAMRFTGAAWVDPALGIAIGALVLWSSYGILRESSHILLEGLPRDLRLENVAHAILRVPGVTEVHDVHIWTLGTDLYALSCHVRIPDMHMDESEKILVAINEILAREFHITHSTVQFERAGLRQTELLMPASADPK